MNTQDIIGIVNDSILTFTLLASGASIWWQLKKNNEDRENGTYDSLDVRFTRFLEICCKYPELEVYNPTQNNWHTLSTIQKRRQLILFQILVSILERSYILYNEKHTINSGTRKHQWNGWVKYMNFYAENETFLHAWEVEEIGEDMDTEFVKFFNNLIIKHKSNKETSK